MTKDAFAPFEELRRRAWAEPYTSWALVEAEFLTAIGAFDAEYARGKRPPGWYQQKARFFNDLVVLLIENCTGKKIATRAKRKSVLFAEIDIDICYPEQGDPIVAAEVKALGTPPHPGNRDMARHARSDLHKRVREVAFTAMDIKAAHAKPRTISSFQGWVDTAEPAYSSFWALRVDGPADLSSVRSILAMPEELLQRCRGGDLPAVNGTDGVRSDALRRVLDGSCDPRLHAARDCKLRREAVQGALLIPPAFAAVPRRAGDDLARGAS